MKPCPAVLVAGACAALALSFVPPPATAAPAPSASPSARSGTGTFIHRGLTGRQAVALSGHRAERSLRAATAAYRALPAVTPAGLSGITASCAEVSVDVTRLTDRAVLRLSAPGATAFTVVRTLLSSPARTAGSASASSGAATFTDLGVNPRSEWSYTVTARGASGDLGSCTTPAMTMAGAADAGEPDFAGAADVSMVMGSISDRSVPVDNGVWLAPAFSADGRLLAAARQDGTIVVRSARTLAGRFSLTPTGGELWSDPAFSPDGQTVAFSRYSEDGTPLGLGFADVFGTHAVRKLDPVFPVVEPSYRPDGSLVGSAFDSAGGLATLCATCSVPTPVPGTEGGFQPEVDAAGVIYFAVTEEFADGTHTSALRMISGGVVSTVFTLTDDYVTFPRTDRQRTLHYQRDSYASPSDELPSQSVVIRAPDPTGAGVSTGLTHPDGSPVPRLFGFDVRQPQTKGSSHLSGDRADDVIRRDTVGDLWSHTRRGVDGTLGEPKRVGTGWQIFGAIGASDFTGDDVTDLIGRDTAGVLWLYRGKPAGGFLARTQMGSGWSASMVVLAPGDFTGDDRADVLARDAAGQLWLYPGTGRGTLGSRALIGTGWQVMNGFLTPGDINGDAVPDLIARDTAGTLWLYPRTTTGWAPRVRIGTGWQIFTGFASAEMTDRMTSIYARTSTGVVYQYPFTGAAVLQGPARTVATGWQGSFMVP